MSFYDELKRRNVLRVTIAYLAGAWLLIRTGDPVPDFRSSGNLHSDRRHHSRHPLYSSGDSFLAV